MYNKCKLDIKYSFYLFEGDKQPNFDLILLRLPKIEISFTKIINQNKETNLIASLTRAASIKYFINFIKL